MFIMVVTVSIGSAIALGVLTWILWKNFQKHEKSGLRLLTGIVMAITGLGALLSGICGVWMTGGI
jgi:hypothetical protein